MHATMGRRWRLHPVAVRILADAGANLNIPNKVMYDTVTSHVRIWLCVLV